MYIGLTLFPFVFLFLTSLAMLSLMLSAIDPSLGRLDFASLTQQAQMENCKDVCKWSWVKCDATKNVKKINWSHHLENAGYIDLAFLPETLEDLQIARIGADGSLDVEILPQVLKIFKFSRNKIQGSVDCAKLPPNLEAFYGGENFLTGSLDLHLMPATVKEFAIQYNQMEGRVKLGDLPHELTLFNISGNSLHSEIGEFDALPERLLRVGIANTTLQGKFQAKWMSKRSKQFFGYRCNLEGSVVLKHMPNALQLLDLSHSRLGGSLDLQDLKKNLWSIVLHHNRLSGTLNFQGIRKYGALPNLYTLYLSANNFSGSIVMARKDIIFDLLYLDSNNFTGEGSIDAHVSSLDISANAFDSFTLRGSIWKVHRDETQNIRDETGIRREKETPKEREEPREYRFFDIL